MRRSLLSSRAPSWVLPGAAVDLDFARGLYYGGTLGSLISATTSATGAYVTNNDGTLSSFPVNVPRIGRGTGLLVEEGRTNLRLNSQTIQGAQTTRTNLSVTDNSAAAPDGTTTAAAFTPTASSGFHYSYNTSAIATSAQAYTISAYIKANAGTWFGLSFGAGTVADGAFFNVFSGSVGTVAASSSASIVALGGGWYRCVVTRALSASNYYLQIEPHSADNQSSNWTSASGAETFYVWGLQFEAGAFPTSYIPTTSAPVARATDVVTATGSALSILGSTNFSGVVATGSTSSSSVSRLLINGSTSTKNFLYYSGSATGIGSYTGVVVLSGTLGSGSSLSAAKAAFSLGGSGRSIVANNGTVATDANVFASSASIYIGVASDGTIPLNGYMTRLTGWPVRLPDATLKALTA